MLRFVSAICFLVLIPGTSPFGTNEKLEEELQEWLKSPHERLRIAVSCQGEERHSQVELFGSGVGIWQERLQFPAPSSALDRIVESLLEADFPGWKSEYGGDVRASQQAVLQMICRVQVEINSARKSVVQYEKGKRFEELFRLAEAIFELTESLRESGIVAASLSDGLEKVQGGALAPPVLEIVVHWKKGHEESILRLDGTQLEAQGTGMGDESFTRTAELTAKEVGELAGKLVDLDFSGLPRNIDIPGYTVVQVRVLDHRHSVQGRDFAGDLASRDEEAGKRLSEARDYLLALGRKTRPE